MIQKINYLFASLMKPAQTLTILLMVGFSACKNTKSISNNQSAKQEIEKPKTLVFQVKSLKANDLEEDLTLSDEIVLTYSLTTVDENNKIVQVANGSWGVESMKKDQEVLGDKFKPIELTIPTKGKMMTSLVLTEIDDYQKAQDLVNNINTIGGLGRIPAMFVSLGEYETPLAVVFASLQAAGVGIKAIDKFDKDDILGQKTYNLGLDFLQKRQKSIPITLNFEGENMKNKYHYVLRYELSVK
jgi:hypothetical protein